MFSVRINIFQTGRYMDTYFSRFPIQVSIIHRPYDEEFLEKISSIALHLDKLTGEYVAFFPMITPPQNMLESVRGTERETWWPHQNMFGGEFIDTLAYSLANYFKLNWSELPALVIAPSLWKGAYLTIPTNANQIENQLMELTNLAKRMNRPSLIDINTHLEKSLGVEPIIVNEETRFLSSFHEFLNTYDPTNNTWNPERYWRLIRNELSIIKEQLSKIRNLHDIDEEIDEKSQAIIQKSANQLIPPACVYDLRYHKDFSDDSLARDIPGFRSLEDESRAFIRSSSILCDYIHFLNNENDPHIHIEDFTPGLQGYWKAFENEMNCSLVQVERACVGIDINNYFTLFEPNFPVEKSTIKTGRDKDLNQKVKGTKKHKYLPLGDNRYVFDTLKNSSKYKDYHFLEMLVNQLGFPLTEDFTDNWKLISVIRNDGSHVIPLNHEHYHKLIVAIKDNNSFPPMVSLKEKIKRVV